MKMIGISELGQVVTPAQPLDGFEPGTEFVARLVERAIIEGCVTEPDPEGCPVTVQVWDEEDDEEDV